MHEGNPGSSATDTRFLVDEAHSLGPQMLEGGIEVDDRVGNVVHALTAGGQELPDRRVFAPGLQQLNVRTADGDHGLLDPLALDNLAVNRLDAVLAAIFRQGPVEVVHRDADVVDVDQEHGTRLGALLSRCCGPLTSAPMRTRPPLAEIRRIYADSHIIAVVGASPDPSKRANAIPSYLRDQGYRIIPVNPNHDEMFGERCYPTLLDVPEPIDVVDVFRPAEQAPEIAEQTVQVGAKVLWLQLGILSDEAAEIAAAGGLSFVEDHCMGQMHAMLGLGPGPPHTD